MSSGLCDVSFGVGLFELFFAWWFDFVWGWYNTGFLLFSWFLGRALVRCGCLFGIWWLPGRFVWILVLVVFVLIVVVRVGMTVLRSCVGMGLFGLLVYGLF